MKKTTIIILLLLSLTVFSQSNQESILKEKINKLEYKLDYIEKKNYDSEIISLKNKLDFQQKMSEQSNSNISNQLASASYNLTLFGLLFAISAIGLGLYVTYVERKIVKIGEENKELLNQNQQIKDDVEALNKLIQSDIYNLFLKIKREETVHILDRLVKVPKDVANICESLLSRDLEQKDFEKLRQAYLNLGEIKNNYHNQYNILFFQHFLGQSLKDEKLRKEISNFIPTGIDSSFENDILTCTFDFVKTVVDQGIQEYKYEINQFFYGLANSEFKTYNPVYQLLFDNLKSRKNRFEIFNTLESHEHGRESKIEFGKLLEKCYSDNNPTQSELLAFTELKELIIVHQKIEDAEKKS